MPRTVLRPCRRSFDRFNGGSGSREPLYPVAVSVAVQVVPGALGTFLCHYISSDVDVAFMAGLDERTHRNRCISPVRTA